MSNAALIFIWDAAWKLHNSIESLDNLNCISIRRRKVSAMNWLRTYYNITVNCVCILVEKYARHFTKLPNCEQFYFQCSACSSAIFSARNTHLFLNDDSLKNRVVAHRTTHTHTHIQSRKKYQLGLKNVDLSLCSTVVYLSCENAAGAIATKKQQTKKRLWSVSHIRCLSLFDAIRVFGCHVWI